MSKASGKKRAERSGKRWKMGFDCRPRGMQGSPMGKNDTGPRSFTQSLFILPFFHLFWAILAINGKNTVWHISLNRNEGNTLLSHFFHIPILSFPFLACFYFSLLQSILRIIQRYLQNKITMLHWGLRTLIIKWCAIRREDLLVLQPNKSSVKH